MAQSDALQTRERVLGECDTWAPFVSLDPGQNAVFMNSYGPMVIIDLVGLIPHHSHSMFSYRPAPVQVWSNVMARLIARQVVAVYAASTGASFVDLFISDAVATTPELSVLWTEKIAVMPAPHFVNNQREWAREPQTRRAATAPGVASGRYSLGAG